MSDVTTNRLLNHLIAIHNRSLPVYLTYAAPAWHGGEEAAKETMRLIAADQRETAERLAAMVTENNGVVNNGEFPIYYTGYHDLSFDFLLNEIIKEQKEDIATIESVVSKLSLVPLAKALAEETLGAAKGHLESLVELKQAAAS
ncbi:MAG: hypothetical protein H6821_11375 [Planctomycetaceae bacterium]|nr:hypothetical protein [Planctomycetales bacterium]MCB9874767.1 hypothetical protein [Planctomycetaceae bacterium]MCB9939033.1 hypothetical protein [Planctomycetaceae bacterium]